MRKKTCLYVIKLLNDFKYRKYFLRWYVIRLNEETETKYIFFDPSLPNEYRYGIDKDMIDKEYEDFFITNSKKKFKKQLEKSYNKIESIIDYDIMNLQSIKDANKKEYLEGLDLLK